MKNTSISRELFYKRVYDIEAQELVNSAINAAREQVQYARAINASRVATILLARRNAGRANELKAETHFRARNSHLRSMGLHLASFIEGIDEKRGEAVTEFLKSEGLVELAAHGRRKVVLRLMDSDMEPKEARKARAQLDAMSETVRTLTSINEIDDYLRQRIGEMTEKKMGNPDPNPWCVLGLLLTSMYIMLIIIAALICALTFGLACEGILDQMLEQACGS